MLTKLTALVTARTIALSPRNSPRNGFLARACCRRSGAAFTNVGIVTGKGIYSSNTSA